MLKTRWMFLLLALLLLACAGCVGETGSAGTLTPVAVDDLQAVYEEIVAHGAGMLPSAVTAEQVAAGSAAGWQYLWEEKAAPRVELAVYENGQESRVVTVLPGSAGLNGTILFGASRSDDGWVWATDLKDGENLQSHRYTYADQALEEPRRLAASTLALAPDHEVWLAALLYNLEDGYAPTNIAALQQDGLDKVPLAAVLRVAFTAAEVSA